MESPIDNRPLTQLLREFVNETTRLFRQEVALARTEMSEKINAAIRDVIYIAAGALVALLGCWALMYAMIRGLAVLLDRAMGPGYATWLSPLLVGLIFAGLGAGLIYFGISTLRQQGVKPQKTAESLQETKRWIQHRAT